MNTYRRSEWARALAVSAAVCLGGATAGAMVTVPAEFGEMVAGSQTVVHGRVVSVQPYDTAGRKTIETRVGVRVIESLKGEATSLVYFRVPGGQIGRYRRVMVGAPAFAEGDEVVLFLRGSAPILPMPFGLTQGVYRVRRDVNGSAFVAPVVGLDAGRVVRGDPARRPIEIGAFVSLVRTISGRTP